MSYYQQDPDPKMLPLVVLVAIIGMFWDLSFISKCGRALARLIKAL